MRPLSRSFTTLTCEIRSRSRQSGTNTLTSCSKQGGRRATPDVSRSRKPSHAHDAAVPPTGQDEYGLTTERKQISVLQIINAYRFLGVRQANLDPLKHQEKSHVPELDPCLLRTDRGRHEHCFRHRFVDRPTPRPAWRNSSNSAANLL